MSTEELNASAVNLSVIVDCKVLVSCTAEKSDSSSLCHTIESCIECLTYTCNLDCSCYSVTVGPNEALFSSALRAKDWNWIPFPALIQPLKVSAKIRHSQHELPATVYPEENGYARVEFETPQRAITPGQAVVLYEGDFVVGSGTICDIL